MKVEKNITVFAGAEPDYAHMDKADFKSEKGRQESKTIFAGDFRGDKSLQERIRQRKEQARQQALKIVRDAWGRDQAIDQSVNESGEHIRQMQEENLHAQDELRDVEQKRQDLMKMYGVTDKTPVEHMPEEYKDRLRELNDYASFNEKILNDNELDIIGENAAIRGIKQAKLKRDPEHTMIGAKEQADEVLEAAGDEIIGMVLDEAKEHQDEEQAKREEQAEKIREKKEEMEELQEKREQNREELEEIIENVPVDEMLELDRTKTNIQQEVQSIVDKMKLVAEDIKGSMVDKKA